MAPDFKVIARNFVNSISDGDSASPDRYPGAARTHIHYTKARVPKDIAKALAVNPSLVQKAVEAFYTRDAFQLRVRHLTLFQPDCQEN